MSTWRVVAALPLLAGLGLGLTGPAVAKEAAVEPGSASGAAVIKAGWWWRLHDATPLDDTPIDAPDPTAPNVPEGTLPVSAAGGEPEKISAIEFSIDAEPGALVDGFTLVLRENTTPGATVNQETAAIVACPVTEAFWAAGEGARWSGLPKHDCEAAQAAGKRRADGTWTFDLTTIAQGWLATGNTAAPAVVLTQDAEAPDGFHVTFDGIVAEGIGVHAVTSAASVDPSAPPTTGGGGTDPVTGGGGADGGAGLSGSSGSGSGSLSSSSTGGGSFAPADDVPPAEPPVAAAAESAVAAAPAAPATTPVAAAAGPAPWYAGIPGVGYVLLPLALGLAYLAMVALGPDAQPVSISTQRGVSRALEKLRRAGGHIAQTGVRA